MKILKICLIVVLPLFIYSCEKETEGLSKVTTPCNIELLGGKTVLVEVGTQYVEYGCKAFEGETDVTSKVDISGTLDTDMLGLYTKRYKVVNSDGAITIAKRLVVVFDPASASGFYRASKDSYRISSAGTGKSSANFPGNHVILIYQEKSGAYNISDLFGGWYEVRDSDPSMACSGTIKINKDGSVSLLSSRISRFGTKFTAVEGKYDAVNKTFDIVVDWESGYLFYLILIGL